MQPESSSSRADAIFEWNRSFAGGGGGKQSALGSVCIVRIRVIEGEALDKKGTAAGGERGDTAAHIWRANVRCFSVKWKKGTDGRAEKRKGDVARLGNVWMLQSRLGGDKRNQSDGVWF